MFGSLVLINQKALLKFLAVSFSSKLLLLQWLQQLCLHVQWLVVLVSCLLGGCVTFQCSELGIVLRCWASAHSGFLSVSLRAPHEAQMKCSLAWLERISTSCASFLLYLKRTMQGLEMVISQHSFFLEMGMGRPSNYRTFAKPQKSYSKEQCEWVIPVHFALCNTNPTRGWIPKWPPLFH